MNFDDFLIGLAIFLWCVLCVILLVLWYLILFDEDEKKQKIIKKTEPAKVQPVTPTTKLRFKKPNNL